MKIQYAWRVLHAGEPTSIVVMLSDAHDSGVMAAVQRAAETQGVELAPLPLDELELVRVRRIHPDVGDFDDS